MATLPDHSQLEFCPLCGAGLGNFAQVIKFCPLCGGNLTVVVKAKPELSALAPEPEPHEASRVAVAGEQSSEINRHMFFDKLKHRLADAVSTAGIAANILQPRYSYYNVVLKDCPNKESLSRKLELVLLRSYPAIRLAVERAPCIVIYKGRIEEMSLLLNVFKTEKAAISVIVGDIDTACPLAKRFPDIAGFSPETRAMIEGVPGNLWLGETVLYVLEDTYLERLGADRGGTLVITAQALYFLYRADTPGRYQWLVIPYDQVRQTTLGSTLYVDGLALMYHDEREDELFVADETEKLTEAVEAVSRAREKVRRPITF